VLLTTVLLTTVLLTTVLLTTVLLNRQCREADGLVTPSLLHPPSCRVGEQRQTPSFSRTAHPEHRPAAPGAVGVMLEVTGIA
jgi:hypothetical protein